MNDEENLAKFLGLLTKFNEGRPLDPDMVANINDTMSYRWKHNRNNFLLDAADQTLFNQLPNDIKTRIYSDFVFSDFIYKFRRFFSFRISMLEAKRTDLERKDDEAKEGDKVNQPKILNKNILRLQFKIRQIMTIMRCLRPETFGRNNVHKLTPEQSYHLTEHYRKRVDQIEKRNKLKAA